MDCRSAPGSGKPRRQRAHGAGGERLHDETADGGRGGHVSPHQAERVAGAHLVVAVRGDQQRAPVHDAAGREPHQVQRRLVRPVQVLEDEHQRPAAAAIASSTSRKRVSLPSEMRTVAPGRRGTTSSGGPRRAGRGEGIAAPGEHGGAVAGHLAEAAHERRLADPRLAPPRPRPTRAGGRLAQQPAQRHQQVAAFQQLRQRARIGPPEPPRGPCPSGYAEPCAVSRRGNLAQGPECGRHGRAPRTAGGLGARHPRSGAEAGRTSLR